MRAKTPSLSKISKTLTTQRSPSWREPRKTRCNNLSRTMIKPWRNWPTPTNSWFLTRKPSITRKSNKCSRTTQRPFRTTPTHTNSWSRTKKTPMLLSWRVLRTNTLSLWMKCSLSSPRSYLIWKNIALRKERSLRIPILRAKMNFNKRTNKS